MKKLKSLGLILIAIFSIITFAGCFDTVQFELSFVVDNEIYYAIKTDGKSTIAMPDDPEKAGYTFDGWYWDENVWQQPFTANSLLNQPLQKDMSVYAKWQVEIPPVEVSSVIFDSSTLAIVVGGQATITATVLPEIATNKTLTWTSSNPAVAIVDNGVVSAIGEGKATITATSSNNLNTTCEVTVVSENQVAVNVYIDGEKVNTIYTSYENNFKITDLEKPEDITTNPNAEKYFYGWFVDSNFQTPLTDNTTFALGGNIYGKWINVYSNDFAYTVSKGKATINSFTNTNNSTVVVVPCYLNSFPVERISSSVFANQTMLRNLIICNGIQYIDDNVFYGCNSMETIELSNTLKEIGTSAFENCELLTEISLPNTLTKINANAFTNCSSLTKVNFGSANWWVTSNENYIFENYVQSSDNIAVVQQLTQTYSNKIWTNYTLFNVIYQLDNGTLPNNAARYFCEHTATFELATPDKKGYGFDGYYQNSNLIDENINQIEKGTKHNVIVYAKYTLINYTITYILNGGTNNENNVSTYNIEIDNIQLYEPSKTGYDFVNWTLNDEVITEIDTKKCENITITANFTPIIYTITCDLSGGISNYANPSTYNIETLTFELINPTKKGYNFIGWTGSNGNTPQTNIIIQEGSVGDKSYTANWTLVIYHITYELNGGTNNLNQTSYSVETETFSLNIPLKSGYTFDGWTGSNGNNPQIDIDITKGTIGDKYYTANWTINIYTINYELIGGICDCDNATTYTIETNTFSLNNPEKTGYTFNGWTGSNGDTPQTNITIQKGSFGNKYYIANWKTIPYYINYDLNNGEIYGENPLIYTIESDDITLINPTNFDYEFAGWTGSNGTIPQKYLTIHKGSIGNRNYKANWLIDYSIDYVLNNGEIEGINPINYNILSDTFTLKNPVKSGYTFIGWTGSNGDTAQLSITIPKGSFGNKYYIANFVLGVYEIIDKPILKIVNHVYNGSTINILDHVNNFNSELISIDVFDIDYCYSAKVVGEYNAKFVIKDKSKYIWQDGTTDDVILNWSISPISIKLPSVAGNTNFTFTNMEITLNFEEYDKNLIKITGNVEKFANTDSETYKAIISLIDKQNTIWLDTGTTDDIVVEWTISKCEIVKPTEILSINQLPNGSWNIESDIGFIESNGLIEISVIDTGEFYIIQISLTDKNNTIWNDGKMDDITLTIQN